MEDMDNFIGDAGHAQAQADQANLMQPYDEARHMRMDCVRMVMQNKPHMDSYAIISEAKALWKFIEDEK